MPTLTRRTAVLSAIGFVLAAPLAMAQQRQIIRGTIEKANGSIITITQTNGRAVDVRLLDNARIFGVEAATAADIKPGDFIGVGAVPQPDGSQKAIQVTIFSEPQRGSGEGFRPWNRPGSTMTNGTAAQVVTSINGQVITVKYKGGEQKIIIGPDAKIRKYVVGSKDALKPGVRIAVYDPKKGADGSLQTARINYGIGSMVP